LITIKANLKKAILFDFDGTLADTMQMHLIAWQKALYPYQIKISTDDYFPYEGMGMRELAFKFTQKLSLTETQINELVEEKKRIYKSQNQEIKFYDGVFDFLDKLAQKNIKIGIVTAGHMDQLVGTVGDEFLAHFDVIVTGEIVLKNKPYPDPYLLGAEKIQVNPDECIVIENAPMGIQAAKAAKMYCIAITSTLLQSNLSLADEVVSDFHALQKSRTFSQLLNGI
jgi:beta-phosphoglucomutase